MVGFQLGHSSRDQFTSTPSLVPNIWISSLRSLEVTTGIATRNHGTTAGIQTRKLGSRSEAALFVLVLPVSAAGYAADDSFAGTIQPAELFPAFRDSSLSARSGKKRRYPEKSLYCPRCGRQGSPDRGRSRCVYNHEAGRAFERDGESAIRSPQTLLSESAFGRREL